MVGDGVASGMVGERTPTSLDPRLPLRAVVVGLLGGLVGGTYRLTLDAVGHVDDRIRSWFGGAPLAWLGVAVAFAAAAALARWLTVRGAPDAAGSGIPQVEEALEGDGAIPRWATLLPVKFVAGGLALLGGLSLGREGPTIHLGAAVATALQRGLDRGARRVLLAAGAASGLTAAFGAPIAGLVFVLEELRVAPSRATLTAVLPAVLASSLVTAALVGARPLFPLPAVAAPRASLLPLFASLGLAAGMVGVLFNRGLLRTLDAFEGLPRRASWAAAGAVGLVCAAVAVWLPEAVGSGERTAAAFVAGRTTWPAGTLGALLATKLALTLLSYGCGVPGGIFSPQLVLGATLGATLHALVPDAAGGTLLPVLATAGMAGVFSASVRAPLTGLILIAELTGAAHLLFPQATTVLVAWWLAGALRDPPIYEGLRARGERGPDGAHVAQRLDHR